MGGRTQVVGIFSAIVIAVILLFFTEPVAYLPSAFDDWTFWQTSATGRVAGIDGDVDMNVFNGDMDALRTFAGTYATCTPGCDGDDLVGADCLRTSCGASGARCADDAGGARCMLGECPPTGSADICVSDTLIAHCEDGAVTSTADCGGYAGLCSVAGREPMSSDTISNSSTRPSSSLIARCAVSIPIMRCCSKRARA